MQHFFYVTSYVPSRAGQTVGSVGFRFKILNPNVNRGWYYAVQFRPSQHSVIAVFGLGEIRFRRVGWTGYEQTKKNSAEPWKFKYSPLMKVPTIYIKDYEKACTNNKQSSFERKWYNKHLIKKNLYKQQKHKWLWKSNKNTNDYENPFRSSYGCSLSSSSWIIFGS